MTDLRPTASIDTQLSQARAVIERHLAPMLLAVHLFGSALDGGLKPYSDIDLLVFMRFARTMISGLPGMSKT